MSTVLLDLFLDNNSIDLWGQYSAFHFKGTVELTLDRPVNIREITVGIKGVLQTIVSTDFPDTMFKEDVGALESSHFKKHPFQKSSLVAIGYAESRQIVLKTKQVVLRHEIPVLYTPNIYRWPFILTLEDPHILPPSILLPRHNIHYQITAHVTLGSLGDHLKVGYWSIYQNARKHALIAYRRLSNPPPLPDQDDSLPDYPSPTYTLTPHQARHSLLSTRIPLQVNQYSTSINGVSPEARRYRGVRQGTIRYETCLPNNTWIGRTRYEFLCEFYPLRQDVTIDEIVCCMEQSETYPVRGGKVQSGQQLSAKDMTTHLHRYCETHYQVNVSDDLSSICKYNTLMQD
ncbi:hypothetical protein J3Q64DRAFT_1076768 [Phycomyces blakesleeanus]|uniref:Arrestin-like N-terminal domain-containing protein n=1 Tax=Phycomyces blakesleeanus TaxID=4837 RepID=A0ABR3BHM8_PHYBL